LGQNEYSGSYLYEKNVRRNGRLASRLHRHRTEHTRAAAAAAAGLGRHHDTSGLGARTAFPSIASSPDPVPSAPLAAESDDDTQQRRDGIP
jgi:hypothetical protein